jgi:hypothetical protein
MKKFGTKSWELDALTPTYLNKLVVNNINEFIDPKLWKESKERIEDIRRKLFQVAEDFEA